MARCEDWPCCGHTDGLPCDWKPPAEYPHAGCDHNAGYCEVWEDGQYDDEETEDDETPCPVCGFYSCLCNGDSLPPVTPEEEIEDELNDDDETEYDNG